MSRKKNIFFEGLEQQRRKSAKTQRGLIGKVYNVQQKRYAQIREIRRGYIS